MVVKPAPFAPGDWAKSARARLEWEMRYRAGRGGLSARRGRDRDPRSGLWRPLVDRRVALALMAASTRATVTGSLILRYLAALAAMSSLHEGQ
ncbi:MAG TPA: hypothetical protein VNZ26_01360 [Vicinamibacterales bacterium]|nr:hypothetical protein [Vicinamibacterales bacterium]